MATYLSREEPEIHIAVRAGIDSEKTCNGDKILTPVRNIENNPSTYHAEKRQ